MTDQPHSPGAPGNASGDAAANGPGNGPGNSGAWQPVPEGGDYDPDQTMHVSFAAQLPPEPRPGEDPLSAHGPIGPLGAGYGDAGYGPGGGTAAGGGTGPGAPAVPGAPRGERDPATQWSIPVIRDDTDSDSGEYPVGYPSPWDQAPSSAAPTSTSSFPAGMFGQGAAAAQAAQAEAAAQARAAGAPTGAHPAAEQLISEWQMPFTGPEGGDAVPWLPAHAPAADAAWSSVVDDPEGPPETRPYGHPGDDTEDAQDAVDGSAAHPAHAGADTANTGAGLDAAAGHDGPEAAGTAGSGHAEDGGNTDAGNTDAGNAGNTGDGPDAVPGPDALAGPGGADTDPAPADSVSEAEPEPERAEETHSEHPLASYMLRVNGTDRPVTDAWLGESLLYVLRERLGLAGAKDGCEQGECGACSVQVDGRLVASCLVPAATAAGSEVRTVEGLTVDGRPSRVQRALAESGAVQCGFCIPGMAMTVHNLLEGNHKPTDLDIRQALSGNLCRCSGYRGVIEAVRRVAADRETDDEAPAEEVRVPHQGGPTGSLGGQNSLGGRHNSQGGKGGPSTPGGAG